MTIAAFNSRVSGITSDPYTWNLEVDTNDLTITEMEQLRTEQSAYLRQLDVADIHYIHFMRDPEGVFITCHGLTAGDFEPNGALATALGNTTVPNFYTVDNKRVREISYYCDKGLVEFVYSPDHPLDPQPPNTLHDAANYTVLIETLRDECADAYDRATASLSSDQDNILP